MQCSGTSLQRRFPKAPLLLSHSCHWALRFSGAAGGSGAGFAALAFGSFLGGVSGCLLPGRKHMARHYFRGRTKNKALFAFCPALGACWAITRYVARLSAGPAGLLRWLPRSLPLTSGLGCMFVRVDLNKETQRGNLTDG